MKDKEKLMKIFSIKCENQIRKANRSLKSFDEKK